MAHVEVGHLQGNAFDIFPVTEHVGLDAAFTPSAAAVS
jgi:hypothetical protein